MPKTYPFNPYSRRWRRHNWAIHYGDPVAAWRPLTAERAHKLNVVSKKFHSIVLRRRMALRRPGYRPENYL